MPKEFTRQLAGNHPEFSQEDKDNMKTECKMAELTADHADQERSLSHHMPSLKP